LIALPMTPRCVSAWGEIAKERAAFGSELLGVEHDVVGSREEALEETACLAVAAESEQRIDQPETTDQERALLAAQPVIRPVPPNGVSFPQIALDGAHGRREARRVGREVHHRRQQKRGVGASIVEGA
jgi:hypothetical protein